MIKKIVYNIGMELEILYNVLMIIMAMLGVVIIATMIKFVLEAKKLTNNLSNINTNAKKIKNNLTLIQIKQETIRNNFDCGLVKTIRVAIPAIYLIKALKSKKYYKASKSVRGIIKVFG